MHYEVFAILKIKFTWNYFLELKDEKKNKRTFLFTMAANYEGGMFYILIFVICKYP